MQGRLTFAFVSLAMAAIALVGLGVLAMTQVGARSNARDRVDSQLETVVEIAAQADDEESLSRSLARISSSFDIDELTLVVVFPNGRVTNLPERGQGSPSELYTIDDDQLENFDDGEILHLDEGRRVFGLQRLDIDLRSGRQNRANASLAVLIGENVARVPRQATSLFLASAAAVLLLALLVATWMARRITQPIRSIEVATTAIARGDLSTRVDVDGGDEIAQLAESVNAMASDLDRSRALEQQFLLSVSHDLRTPLTAISGYAEALIDGAVTDPVATGSIISNHADRLGRLVTDLLQLARLDANSFSIDTANFNVVEVVAETAAGLRPSARAVSVSISVDTEADSVLASGDRGRTAQIVSNLIENGLKFAESNVIVRLRRDGGFVSIAVVDDGPGIDESDLPHVFDRLYVAKLQPKRAETSSGLGLAIVRELARAMGGSVTASHNPTGGAVMTVLLPAGGAD